MILVELCLYVARDGEVKCAGVMIPFKGDAAVQFDFLVHGDLVERLEGPNEEIGVFRSFIFEANVVYYEGEGYGAGLVAPQARRMRGWGKAELCMVLLEMQVGDESDLREAVHSILYFDVHVFVVQNRKEIVLLDYLFGDHVDG